MNLFKRRIILIFMPLLGVLALLGFLAWLLVTPAGLHFVLDKATTIGGIKLSYDNLQGTIASKISAEHLAYQDDSVKLSLDNLETEISLFWLLDARIAFEDTKINAIEVVLQGPRQSPGKASTDFTLPLGISFSTLSVNKLSIAESKPIVTINNIAADKIKLDHKIDLDRLKLSMAGATLIVDGSLGFARTSDLDVKASWEVAASESLSALAGESRLRGNFEELTVKTELQQPQTAQLKTRIKNIFTNLSWRSTLTSNSFNPGLLLPAIDISLEKINLELGGDLKSVEVRGTANVSDSRYGNWNAQVRGRFDEKQWELSTLQLDSPGTGAKVLLQAKSTSALPYSPESSVELVADWQQLQWPVTGKAEYLSKSGRALVNGTLNNYQIATTGQFSFGDYHFGDIVAEGTGTPSTLSFDSIQLTYLDGNWQGETSLDWSTAFQWQAALNVKGANPGVQWKQLAGELNGLVSGRGKHQEDNWLITGEIKNFSGQFRDYPVSGGSQFSVSGKEYAFKGLALRSGDNTLSGSIAISDYLGDADTKVSSNWKLNANNLSQLITNAAGSIISKGKIQGSFKAPSLDATVNTKNFIFDDYQFSKATLQASGNLQRNDNLSVRLETGQGKIKDTILDQFSLVVSGTTFNHDVVMNATLKDKHAIQLGGTGGYQQNQWTGKLTALLLTAGAYGDWKLSAPSSMRISEKQITISKACISTEIQEAVICSDIDSRNFSSYKINSEIRMLPVSLLRQFLPPSVVKIDGIIAGNAQLSIDNQKIKAFSLSMESKGGELTHTLINNTPTAVSYRQLLVKAEHKNDRITISSNMDLQQTGSAYANLAFTDVKTLDDLNAQQPVTGEINIKIDDLSLLPVFFPDIQSIQGTSSSQFRISGTLGTPKLTGNSFLKADRMTLPVAGLELTSTQLRAKSSPSRKLTLEGSTQSGEGQISIKGEIPDYLDKNLLVKLEISGKHFLAAKIPDIEMEISPQFSLILEGNTVNMDGEVYVDRAQVTPLESYSGLTPSSDVVFIDQQQQTSTRETFKLQGSLRLRLSDRVFVQTAGFNGKVTGELVITESANNVTLATGELIIKDGRYTAPVETSDLPGLLISIAQKELLIDESKLIFASSPIDNPRLDIRARRPTGNEIVVGVDIRGHVNNPQILLFSEPAMDQADILAYLTLGYPLTEASKNDGQYLARIASSIGLVGGEKLAKNIAKEFGIDEVYIQSQDTTQHAQLVLGKYLSPRLYVRYAVGIGEAVDTLQIQYKLTDRWLLRTETAETQKGTDLIYTIDK